MIRLPVIFDHAIPSVGLAMASLQGLLLRASYVGITGIFIELSGRFALTVIHASLGRRPPRALSAHQRWHHLSSRY